MRTKAKGRPLVAPMGGGGGAERVGGGRGGEDEGSMGSIAVGQRIKKGF